MLRILKTCKAYISVLGNEEAKDDTIAGPEKCRRLYQQTACKEISNLRNTPEIRFILDESIEYGVAMSKLIDEVTGKEEVQEDGENNQ